MWEFRRNLILGSVVAIIVALSLGFGIYYVTPSSSTSVSTSTTSCKGTTQVFSNSLASSGFRLDLFIAPCISTAGLLVINADEYNTLNLVNNISTANDWQYSPTSLTHNPCGATGAVGVAIFSGYYTLSNFTSAKALPLYNTTQGFSCTVSAPNGYYMFNPQSSDAVIVVSHSYVINPSLTTFQYETKGYWSSSSNNPTFKNFPQGNYTALAADEWGKVALVHFTVSSYGFSSYTSSSST
jgi:hypothetical protein